MAKAYYKEWLDNDHLLLLKGWRRQGLNEEQIAEKIGINIRTLGKWKAKYGQIRQALKRGKEHANFLVESALLKSALEGNTTAQIFWLKSNYREKYSEYGHDEWVRQRSRKLEAESRIKEAEYRYRYDNASIMNVRALNDLTTNDLKNLANNKDNNHYDVNGDFES